MRRSAGLARRRPRRSNRRCGSPVWWRYDRVKSDDRAMTQSEMEALGHPWPPRPDEPIPEILLFPPARPSRPPEPPPVEPIPEHPPLPAGAPAAPAWASAGRADPRRRAEDRWGGGRGRRRDDDPWRLP